MRFSKVKISKDDEVELSRLDVHKHSKDAIETSGINPLPSFKDALSAFLPLFLRVVPWLEEVKDHLRISTLTLGEKDGDRSLQISATLSIDACGGSGISMTTPRITTPPEGAKEGQVYLTAAERKLIDNIDSEAERYYNGETAQGDVFVSSENAEQADQRMAAGEAATTRQPPKKKSKPGKAADAMMSTGQFRQLLLSVERNISETVIVGWTDEQRAEAQAWAEAKQKELIGQTTDLTVPAEPPHVIAGSWADATPPAKATPEAVDNIKTAVAAGVQAPHLVH